MLKANALSIAVNSYGEKTDGLQAPGFVPITMVLRTPRNNVITQSEITLEYVQELNN